MYSVYKVKILSFYENSKIMKMSFMRQLEGEIAPTLISEDKFDFAFAVTDLQGNQFTYPEYFKLNVAYADTNITIVDGIPLGDYTFPPIEFETCGD
jgi:hypothetical protein